MQYIFLVNIITPSQSTIYFMQGALLSAIWNGVLMSSVALSEGNSTKGPLDNMGVQMSLTFHAAYHLMTHWTAPHNKELSYPKCQSDWGWETLKLILISQEVSKHTQATEDRLRIHSMREHAFPPRMSNLTLPPPTSPLHPGNHRPPQPTLRVHQTGTCRASPGT